MSSLIRNIPLLGVFLVPAMAVAACNPVEEVGCPLAKCAFQGDEGVNVTIAGALEKFSGDLPATITLCAENRCAEVSLRIAGKSFACISEDIRATCEVAEDGTLSIGYAVMLPDAKEKKDVQVRLSVQGASGATLFEETKAAPTRETNPAGLDCPQVCREADVAFSATGEPQQPEQPAQPEQPGQPGQPGQPAPEEPQPAPEE